MTHDKRRVLKVKRSNYLLNFQNFLNLYNCFSKQEYFVKLFEMFYILKNKILKLIKLSQIFSNLIKYFIKLLKNIFKFLQKFSYVFFTYLKYRLNVFKKYLYKLRTFSNKSFLFVL